jgi:hypothetical protein
MALLRGLPSNNGGLLVAELHELLGILVGVVDLTAVVHGRYYEVLCLFILLFCNTHIGLQQQLHCALFQEGCFLLLLGPLASAVVSVQQLHQLNLRPQLIFLHCTIISKACFRILYLLF